VVDDASDDNETLEQLRYMNEHCTVIYLAKHEGLAHAANIGIARAKGQYVMRLDADDWLAVHHLEKMMSTLLRHDGNAIYSDYWPFENGKIGDMKIQKDIPLGSCMIFKKELWEEVGGYNESLKYQEDVDFWNRITKFATPIHLAEPTWYYRKHAKQMSTAHNAKMKVRQKILDEPRILTVIPARGNSKGVVRKNLQTVGGLTLVERAIKMIKDSGITTQIIVSTEDHEISTIATNEGVDFIIARPPELAEDDVSTIPVVIHAMNKYEETGFKTDIVVSVQPTSPFTPPEALANGVQKLLDNPSLDSVVCVSEIRKHPYRTYFKNEGEKDSLLYPYFSEQSELFLQRQDRPKAYGFTGGFYIRRKKLLDDWNGKGFALGNCGAIIVNQLEGLDIDTEDDLFTAQLIGERTCT
jgi:CMP-N-acetylneuraminic acid synthetase